MGKGEYYREQLSLHATAVHLALRFSPSHHLHTRCVDPTRAVTQIPLAQSTGIRCAVACNPGKTRSRAFARDSFDNPFPFNVLHAHAGIAALDMESITVSGFTSAIIRAVDEGSVGACCSGDEYDVGCRHDVGLTEGAPSEREA